MHSGPKKAWARAKKNRKAHKTQYGVSAAQKGRLPPHLANCIFAFVVFSYTHEFLSLSLSHSHFQEMECERERERERIGFPVRSWSLLMACISRLLWWEAEAANPVKSGETLHELKCSSSLGLRSPGMHRRLHKQTGGQKSLNGFSQIRRLIAHNIRKEFST